MIEEKMIDRLMALPAEDRLALAERLWNSLSAEASLVPMPAWHSEILTERLDDDASRPDDIESWTEVRRQIEQKE